jgi:tripartite-type tricarboxylate transporter receptor subunit TctC
MLDKTVLRARRDFLKRLGSAIGLALHSQRRLVADDRPLKSKTIRFIVPHPVGGGFDAYARLIEPFFERETQAEVVIENLPGAGGRLGASRLMRASPDGLGLGILDAPGLLVTAMAGDQRAPHVVDDFTILGRVARSRQIWITGSKSGLQTAEDLLTTANRRPIVIGITEVGATHFLNAVVGAHLLAIRVRFVPGYRGSRQATLAAIRGEVDVVVYHFESIASMLEDGDVRPLLQVSDQPIAAHSSLTNVPLLGGDDGLAVRRARERGSDPERAKSDAAALAAVVGAGRLIAGPRGFEDSLREYLERVTYGTLTSSGFTAAAAKARRTLDVARADAALSDLKAGVEAGSEFIGLMQKAIRDARG